MLFLHMQATSAFATPGARKAATEAERGVIKKLDRQAERSHCGSEAKKEKEI